MATGLWRKAGLGSGGLKSVIAWSPKGSVKRAALGWLRLIASRMPAVTGSGRVGTRVTVLAPTNVGPPFDLEWAISETSGGINGRSCGLGSICTGSHCTCGCMSRRTLRIGPERRLSIKWAELCAGDSWRHRGGVPGSTCRADKGAPVAKRYECETRPRELSRQRRWARLREAPGIGPAD